MRSQAASTAVLTVLALAAVAGVVLVVAASAGSVLLAAGRAQDGADAAALAAAHAVASARSPADAAATAAAAHGATVVACDCRGRTVAVTVRVAVAAPAARGLGITEQHATARAGMVARRARPAQERWVRREAIVDMKPARQASASAPPG